MVKREAESARFAARMTYDLIWSSGEVYRVHILCVGFIWPSDQTATRYRAAVARRSVVHKNGELGKLLPYELINLAQFPKPGHYQVHTSRTNTLCDHALAHTSHTCADSPQRDFQRACFVLGRRKVRGIHVQTQQRTKACPQRQHQSRQEMALGNKTAPHGPNAPHWQAQQGPKSQDQQ